MTVRGYITEALRILETRSTDPVAIPGAIERLLDALYELDNAEILGREDRPESWCVLIPDPKRDE